MTHAARALTMRRLATRTAILTSSARTSVPSGLRTVAAASARVMPYSSSANPFSPSIPPADSFQLLPESQKAGEAEDALYEAEIKAVEAWWSSPRYAGIKRPYSAEDVVSKRGSQSFKYPSSVMATKLFNLIREREAKGEPIHTSTSAIRPSYVPHAELSQLETHFIRLTHCSGRY